MAYKVFNKSGKSKSQMNNASSMKTNAAMYASKTSMYGKPMMNGGPGDDEKKKIASKSAEHSGLKPGRPKVGGGEVQTKQHYNENDQIKELKLISKVRSRAAEDYKKNKGKAAGNSRSINEVLEAADPNLSEDQKKALAKRLAGQYHAGYKKQ